MKHYIDKDNNVFAYELDGSQDAFIKNGLVPISDEELAILREPSATEIQLNINAEALAYLASTDWLIIRQQEAGIVVPPDITSARVEARSKIVKES